MFKQSLIEKMLKESRMAIDTAELRRCEVESGELGLSFANVDFGSTCVLPSTTLGNMIKRLSQFK